MEKAIEIKRRAQRCIQNGDLDGALREYEKLVSGEDADPYNHVLLADLLYRKGEQIDAAERYLDAVTAYERASLFKNAIAVCKKMVRLSLSPAKVLKHLAQLHALDGLAGEASLYHVQYAEQMVRSNEPAEAAVALRAAFDVCQDNVRVLEQLAEAHLLLGEELEAARTLQEAAGHYRSRGQEMDASRVLERAAQFDPTGRASEPADSLEALPSSEPAPAEPAQPDASGISDSGRLELDPKYQAMFDAKALTLDGLESTRHEPSATESESPVAATESAAAEGPAEEWDPADAPTLHSPGTPVSTAAPEAPTALEPESEPEAGVFEIADEDAEEVVLLAAESEEAEAAGAGEPVYDIDTAASPPEPLRLASTPEPAGLAFQSAPSPDPDPMALVEKLLAEAQEQFRAGEREAASATLTSAAQAYETLGRMDSAATIYRSLGRGAQATPELMRLWLANCEARGDVREAAQVACELGDRSLNDGDAAAAQAWFERAAAFDPTNETAHRRLSRLAGAANPGDLPALAPPAGAPNGIEPGRVEVAVGRAEAVTFDLSGLLTEFQRGVEAQLSGDSQSHYDLGMTYREMGLLEQAVDSFRISELEPALNARSLEMVGRCFSDMGRWAEATVEFSRALSAPGLDEVAAAELRYHLGVAMVHAGDTMMALQEFEKVASVLEGYEDVDDRIASLREQLGKAA